MKQHANSGCVKNKLWKKKSREDLHLVGLSGSLEYFTMAAALLIRQEWTRGCGKEAEKIQQIRVFRYLYINGTLFGIIKKMGLVWTRPILYCWM